MIPPAAPWRLSIRSGIPQRAFSMPPTGSSHRSTRWASPPARHTIALGRGIASIDLLGNRSTTVFDGNNRPIASINALGYASSTLYDLASRPDREH